MVTKEEALKEIGLNDKEIKIYLSSLILGQSSVNTISKKAFLNRVTTYDILKSLSQKGFVSYVIKSGVKYFEAVDPSKFLDDLKEKQEKIQSVIPELQEIKKSILENPNIETYEGINGLKSIFNDILKEDKETWFIGAPKMLDKLEFYFPHFIKQKRKQRIYSKVITEDCKEMHEYKKKAPKKYINMKFTDKAIRVTKIIYGNKVAYLTFDKDNSIGILIDNKEIVEQERVLFEVLWKLVKN
jgi:sugar-specific transcriptional regulator TrmB